MSFHHLESPTNQLFIGTGTLQKVDVESLNNLIQQYDLALEENTSKKNQFKKFRDDYVQLKSRLKSLPEKLEYDAMVPVCSKALCPGKIIHTNEILCLLGDNWFVELSAKKAAEIVSHRLKSIDDTLNRLEKEKEIYNTWKFEAERQMVETLGEGTIEIVEDYDEDQEKEWRKKHRESVKNYHQQKAKKKKLIISSSDEIKQLEKTDTELWTRLDALELEEEFMEAQAAYEEKIYNSSDKILNLNAPKIREKPMLGFKDLLDEQIANVEADIASYSGKKVKWSTENIIHNLSDLSIKESKRKGKEREDLDNKEEIELYKPSKITENGLFDPIFIRFGAIFPDSSIESKELIDTDTDSDSDSEYEDYQIVHNPRDIFDQFGPPSLEAKSITVPGADKTPLKSILKPRCPDTEKQFLSHNEVFITANYKSRPNHNHNQDDVIAKKVSERLPVPKKSVQLENPTGIGAKKSLDMQSHSNVCSTKPVSLFKRMKQGMSPPGYQEG